MNLWITQHDGQDAIGELPDTVALELIPPEGEPPEAILDAEFLVLSSRDRSTRALLGRMSALRVIQTLSAGVDWLLADVPPGVRVCDAAGARDAAVAEWVLAAVLASTRCLPELRDRQREHRWEWQQSGELAGSMVLILGYGAIGAAVEARLAPFEVEFIRVARHARPGVHAVAGLASLLPRADAIIVLLPLTLATAGLLDADMLSRLRPNALLINAARGPIVDTAALLALLRGGNLRAVLDVTDPEPLPSDHPLWDAPGLLITPHFAGDTLAADRRAFALAGEQVRRYVRGEALLNAVEGDY